VAEESRTEERFRFVAPVVVVAVVVVVGGKSGRGVKVSFRRRPRRPPEDRCAWSVSGPTGAGVLGGSALIFWPR